MSDKQYNRLVTRRQAMAKALGVPCVFLKKCSRETAPVGAAFDHGHGVVGSDGQMGADYICNPCDPPTMTELDSQMLTYDESGNESDFF